MNREARATHHRQDGQERVPGKRRRRLRQRPSAPAPRRAPPLVRHLSATVERLRLPLRAPLLLQKGKEGEKKKAAEKNQ